jgi:hypothetical protein
MIGFGTSCALGGTAGPNIDQHIGPSDLVGGKPDRRGIDGRAAAQTSTLNGVAQRAIHGALRVPVPRTLLEAGPMADNDLAIP